MATKAKKTPVKKSTKATKVVTRSKKKPSSHSAALKSFRPSKEPDFFSFKISMQTVYWTILVVVVIVLQLLIINAQLEAANSTSQLYNTIQNK